MDLHDTVAGFSSEFLIDKREVAEIIADRHHPLESALGCDTVDVFIESPEIRITDIVIISKPIYQILEPVAADKA